MKRAIFLLFTFFLSQHFVLAQTPMFKNYTTNDGLPSSENFEIIQDKKGYIWIASDKGVSRFDGDTFETFTTKDGLPDNSVIRLYEDDKGRIWFLSYTGKLVYYLNGKIHALAINDELLQKVKGMFLVSIAVKDEVIYLGTSILTGIKEHDFLVRIDLKGRREKLIFDEPYSSDHVYYNELGDKFYYGFFVPNHSISQNKKQNNFGHRFFHVKKNGITLDSFLIFYPIRFFNNQFRCTKLKNGNVLLCYANQLFLFNSKTGKLLKQKDFGNFRILIAFQDSKNGLWIGTEGNGLFYFPDGNFNGKPQIFFPGNSFGSILEDREGSLWFSSTKTGVYYLKGTKYFHYYPKEILNSQRITTMCLNEAKNGLLLGMENGKVAKLDKGKITSICSNDSNSFKQEVISIFPINASNTIIGRHGITPFQQVHNNKFKSLPKTLYFSLTDGLVLNNGKSIMVSSYHTVCKLKYNFLSGRKKNTFINELKKMELEDIIPLNFRVFAMVESKDSVVWFATLRGLFCYRNGNLIDYGKICPELTTRINDIKISDQQRFWMATKNKGLMVKLTDNKIVTLNDSNGLLGNICSSVFIENENSVWISTDKGLSNVLVESFQPFKFNVINYTTKDGLLSNEVLKVILLKDTVYALCNQGITCFNKNIKQFNSFAPPIYIDKLSINDNWEQKQDSIFLKYNQNNFSISYTGLSYQAPALRSYKYRMLGLSDKWFYTKMRMVNFTTLPPGEYIFEVMARNNDGVWSTRPAQIAFFISPPFWATWWFITIIVAVIIFLIYLIIKYNINRIEKRELEKTNLFKKMADSEKQKAEFFQKANEMELKFLSAQMNPHFTFNAMNSIQNFILENDPLKANKYLTKYSRLMRMVLENNMQTSISLKKEIEMLSIYADLERVRMDIETKVEFIIDEELNQLNIGISPMLIQPYIENAFWHGLKHKKQGLGEIIVSLTKVNENIKCTVTDNGVGRQLAASFNNGEKKHKSYGIFITQKRLMHLHNQSDNLVKTITEDVKDADGNIVGTQVQLFIPFSNIETA